MGCWMRLHEDKALFAQAIRGASVSMSMPEAMIEKDHYVTALLKSLAARVPGLVFKGGTSLSKCYHAIDRFSEDIDLTLDEDHRGQANKKFFKLAIVDACEELGVKIENIDEIKSRRDFNRYLVSYDPLFGMNGLSAYIAVETAYMQKPYPVEKKKIESMICNWMVEIGDCDAVNEFELAPFEIEVQTLERTFVDKVFAVCDYYLSKKFDKTSRHIYDIYRLSELVVFDDELKRLAKLVREERRTGKVNYSAASGVSVSKILAQAVKEDAFKSDYQNVTLALLTKPVEYRECIDALARIVDSKIFD